MVEKLTPGTLYWICATISEDEDYELLPPEPRRCIADPDQQYDAMCLVTVVDSRGEPLPSRHSFLNDTPVPIRFRIQDLCATREEAVAQYRKNCIAKAKDYMDKAMTLAKEAINFEKQTHKDPALSEAADFVLRAEGKIVFNDEISAKFSDTPYTHVIGE